MENINITQIGQSACGPTSVLNVLGALDFKPLPSPESLLKLFPARLRDYKTKSVSKYLYSRAVAGTIHQEIIDTIEKVTDKKIIGKFFIIRPYEDTKNFIEWLEKCFENKIAMIFTENLFIVGNDAWHHQMGYGIKDNKIYLTNPMEKISVSKMLSYLTAGTWMSIPREHIKERNLGREDFEELKKERWENFSVLEKIREIKSGYLRSFNGNSCFSDLIIPYGGIGGISLFCSTNNKLGMDFLNKYKEEKIFLPIYEKSVNAVKLNL